MIGNCTADQPGNSRVLAPASSATSKEASVVQALTPGLMQQSKPCLKEVLKPGSEENKVLGVIAMSAFIALVIKVFRDIPTL